MATQSDRILEVDILLACKPLQWFVDHPSIVLKLGQAVFIKDDGRYKLGNGTTQLSALTFFGGIAPIATWASLLGSPIDSIDLVAYLTGNYEQLINKGAANGYASLDAGGKIPASQLPHTVMQYQGQWDASTNTPTLTNGTANAGDVYEVTIAGTHDFGSGNIEFKVGDWVVYNNSDIWEKSINSNEVVSVNGLSGAVNLIAHDILLTGYIGGVAGVLAAADSVRDAISKLDGNITAQNPIITTIVSSASPTPVLSANTRTDQLIITGLNIDMVLDVPIGAAPVEGKMVMVSICDSGAAKLIGYNAIYVGSINFTLPDTTVAGLVMHLGFKYWATTGKYHLVAKTDGY